MSAKTKLKKCPLCRAKARFAKWVNGAEVYCNKCGVRIERQSEEEVVAAWNRRAEEGATE